MEIPENIVKAIEEINEASLEIPFGNSDFQNIYLVLNGEITPGRKVRHCLLRLNNRLNALKECYYGLEIENIDIEEIEDNINEVSDKYEKRRLLVKLEQKKTNRIQTNMLIKDCLCEIDVLYKAFKNLPKYTREQFESEEKEHFELKMTRDAYFAIQFPHAVGQLQSLDNMNNDCELLLNAISSNEGAGIFKKKLIDARDKTKYLGE